MSCSSRSHIPAWECIQPQADLNQILVQEAVNPAAGLIFLDTRIRGNDEN